MKRKNKSIFDKLFGGIEERLLKENEEYYEDDEVYEDDYVEDGDDYEYEEEGEYEEGEEGAEEEENNYPVEKKNLEIDLVERDNDLIVYAPIPGISSDDLDISITHDSITIRTTQETESEHEDGDFIYKEISRGQMSRTITLPAEVEVDSADANIKDGQLKIILPKINKEKKRKLQIKKK